MCTEPIKKRVVNICTRHDNGAGLAKDAALVKRIYSAAGYDIVCSNYNDPDVEFRAVDVTVFVELIDTRWFDHSKKICAVLNPEWYEAHLWDSWLPRIDAVWCKTRDAQRIMSARVGERAIFTGWEAEDLYDGTIERERVFFHASGKSVAKNSIAVALAWKKHNLPYKLVVSAFEPCIVDAFRGVPTATVVSRFAPDDFRGQMNRCAYFVLPSWYEGYGHAIAEAQSCGAYTITTNAAPMNEFGCSAVVNVVHTEPWRIAQKNFVDVDDLAAKVTAAYELSDRELALNRAVQRGRFEDRRREFRNRIMTLVA